MKRSLELAEKLIHQSYLEKEEYMELLGSYQDKETVVCLGQEAARLREKYYGNKSNLTKAIDNISFTIEKGEFVGIMGASGSGKTTLLNCISTIDRVTAGKIIINNQDITRLKGNNLNKFRREELGFIFQDFNLLDTLTAYENIALALTIQKVKPKEIEERV